MSDLISRADAKQQISEWATIITKPTLLDKDATMVVLDLLPSADAVHGEWILVKGSNGKDYHKCSKCSHTQEITGVKNYCAVCGARMKGGDDE